jgi:type II secretory pathway component GspD/PulD (secretin)
MKTKASILLLASLLAAQSQTNPLTESSAPAPVVIATTNGDPAASSAQFGTATAPTAASAATSAASAIPAAPDIPLIQFADASLTTAIEQLARKAGINYLLDPKIGYGLADANGQIKVEPTISSIRWENIPADKALLALLDNYGLQLVRNRDTDIDRITIKDPAAPPPLITRVIQLKYASVSNLLDAAQSTLTDKRSKVITDPRTSQLVVVATDPEQLSLDVLVERLDTPTKQVLIETRLVEISSNPTSKKGIDWAGTLGGQHVTFGNNLSTAQNSFAPGAPITQILGTNKLQINQQQLSGLGVVGNTASGLGTMGFLNADGLSAVISLLNASSDAQVVSTPRIVTLDNQMANISVTRGYPVFNVSAGTANTAGGSSITYSNVGTVLQVTPRISAGDKVWLKVHPEVSSFFGTVSKTVGGQVFQADLFDNRTFDTQVLIPNAHTLVLGGLVKDAPNSSKNKVPIFGDIPVIGYAFRSESKSMDKQNLLIFITPTILKDSDFHATKTRFLEAQPIKTKQFLNPDSSWDGTRPASRKKSPKDPQLIINENVIQ